MATPVDTIASRACWIVAPGAAEIRTEALAASAAPGQLRVRTLYTGISRGTESRVFRGEVPPTEYQRMRAPFQAGEFPGPVKYGYCNVGQVVDGPADWLDRRVFCLYPHQTDYQVPIAAVHPLPATVPAGRAVLAANLETAVNALWDLQPLPGDRVAIVGGGVVGLLVAWLLARIPGTAVELVDVEPAREAIAASLGVGYAAPDRAAVDCDAVVHASGRSEGLVTALRLAGTEARVLELSWYGDRQVTLPLGEAFHSRRLTLRASQVGSIAPSQRPRWNAARRLSLVMDLLAEPRLDGLITGESAFDDLPAVLARLATTRAPQTLCHRIRYDDAPAPSGSAGGPFDHPPELRGPRHHD